MKIGRFLPCIFGAVVMLLPFGVAAGGEETCPGPPAVLVPVSLDGVPYDAAEFNTINRDLYCKGIATYSIADSGAMHVFTTLEGHNEYARKVGVGPLLSEEQMERMVRERPVEVVGEKGGDIIVFPAGEGSPRLEDPEVAPLAGCPPPI